MAKQLSTNLQSEIRIRFIYVFRMKLILFVLSFIYYCLYLVTAKHRSVVILDQNYVCHIKRSCLECLKLPQCTWCPTENKCYAEQLMTQKGYCENATIRHIEYGMSITENAECSCASGNMERNCIPPGAAQEEECSGRGKCVCGRCFCDANPDHQNPTKAVMGEYCEYDNFSCDGAKCNEGPYNINEQKIFEEESQAVAENDIAQPLEE